MHSGRIVRGSLADGSPLGHVEFPLGIIDAAILIVDVDSLFGSFVDDFHWHIGNIHKEI